MYRVPGDIDLKLLVRFLRRVVMQHERVRLAAEIEGYSDILQLPSMMGYELTSDVLEEYFQQREFKLTVIHYTPE